MAEQYTYETGSFYILNELGNVIFAKRDEMIGRNIKDILGSKEVIREVGTRSEKILTFKAVNEGVEYTGSNYTLSNNWVIGVMPTSKEVSADFSKTCTTLIITVIVVLIIICILSIVFGNMMSRPITKLIGIADKIANGDLTEEIVVTKNDEAISVAKKSAKPGQVVLFSPASASFDMFKNFADRGEQFKDLVNNSKILIGKIFKKSAK